MDRDRHQRGIRGPLALPHDHGARPARPRRPPSRGAFFDAAVTTSVHRIRQACPRALAGVRIGVEDVPPIPPRWVGGQVPLAAAIEATATEPAQVVVYRRPLEHRGTSREDLRDLVHRALVEQLAALTAIGVDELDPGHEPD